MNEQTKKASGKFNFFDFLLILLVVLVIVGGAAFFFLRGDDASEDSVRVRYTVVVKDLVDDINLNIHEGQDVTDTVRHNIIGKVTAVKTAPAVYDAYNQEAGELVHGTYEDLKYLYVTIEADAVSSDREYTVGGMTVAMGTLVYFRTPTFIGSGFVTAFDEIAAE